MFLTCKLDNPKRCPKWSKNIDGLFSDYVIPNVIIGMKMTFGLFNIKWLTDYPIQKENNMQSFFFFFIIVREERRLSKKRNCNCENV